MRYQQSMGSGWCAPFSSWEIQVSGILGNQAPLSLRNGSLLSGNLLSPSKLPDTTWRSLSAAASYTTYEGVRNWLDYLCSDVP